MNLFQKFSALFGAEYAVIFVKYSWSEQVKVSVQRVKKLADRVWVIAHCKTLLKPGGGVGDARLSWKPVTKEASKFYSSELSRRTSMTERYESRASTHADDCWSWGPAHYECAVRKIKALLAERDDLLENGKLSVGHRPARTGRTS